MINNLSEKRKYLILVVDDSKFIRFTFRQFLETEGYKVAEAESGNVALSLFTKLKPDIVLMDFVMPGIDGVTTCAQLQALPNGKHTPVIMITSLEDEYSVNLAFEAGATDFISKPINWAVLRQRLSRLLEARHTQLTLNEREAFSSSIINHAIEGIITTDIHGIIVYTNPAIEKIFGYLSSDVLGRNINILIPDLNYGDYDDIYYNNKFTDSNKEMLGYHKNASTLPIDLTVSKFYVGETSFLTIILRDITERKCYEEMIKHQALYDSLTDLPNRFLLKERMAIEIAHTKNTGHKIAVMYLDLDRFKLINDTLGHDVGDKLLKKIAQKLQNCVPSNSCVARMGGDEFVILLPGITHEVNVGNIANKILNTIREPLIIDKHTLYLTISIGIAISSYDSDNNEVLLTNADIAMYRAKEKGKNNFQIYSQSLNAKALKKLSMETSLRRAIEYKEFVVYYQPKVNSTTEKLNGMEALIRWQHPEKGLMPPLEFIPLAEKTGLIVPIGEWVLRTACTQNKMLQDTGFPPLIVAVNLSARQFELQDLFKMVSNTLEQTGMDPQYLELEITEGIAMHNIEHTLKTIRELQAIGVRFAIDDFGTGYSSLSRLNSFSVNTLKIDKSFVSNINENKDTSIIASTVLALGKSLGMDIVAEGVETKVQANFFKENNCNDMQGFFFGKPMCKEDFEKFYHEKLQ